MTVLELHRDRYSLGCGRELAEWRFLGSGLSYHPLAPLGAQASQCQDLDTCIDTGQYSDV